MMWYVFLIILWEIFGVIGMVRARPINRPILVRDIPGMLYLGALGPIVFFLNGDLDWILNKEIFPRRDMK